MENNSDDVIKIPMEKLHGYKNNPYKVRDDEELEKMVDSISKYGVLNPIIVRKKGNNYEIISGHRRREASKIVGLKDMPAIVKDLTDDEAAILVVDSNIQREEVLPSERAFAYKMKLTALKHQGKKIDLKESSTSDPVGWKLETANIIGNESGQSMTNVRRYIRLTYLIPNLLKLVDDTRISFRPAVELSYLTKEHQQMIEEYFECNEVTPSLSQAIQLKKLEQKGLLNENLIDDILSQEKPNQKEQFKASYDKIRQYFPKNFTNEQIDEKIMELLESYQRRWKEHFRNRDSR